MTRCPSCGQVIETERDKANRDVFVWTLVSVLFIGSGFTAATWTFAWWVDRKDLLCIQLILVAVTVWHWVRFVRVRRQTDRGAAP